MQYEQAILVAFKEVEDALISVQKTREQLIPQGRRVNALRDYMQMARLRYDEGYTSYIEVLDSERSLFDAETSFAKIQGTVSSISTWYSAVGGQPRPTGCPRKLCLLKIDENLRVITSNQLRSKKADLHTVKRLLSSWISGGATLLTNMARFIRFQRPDFWIM